MPAEIRILAIVQNLGDRRRGDDSEQQGDGAEKHGRVGHGTSVGNQGFGGDQRRLSLSEEALAQLTDQLIAQLKTVYDPEIPVDIYELGLIYEVRVDPGNDVHIRMTLTSPACPVAETLPPEVEQKVRNIPDVNNAKVELTFEPPWDKEMMSEEARMELGFW